MRMISVVRRRRRAVRSPEKRAAAERTVSWRWGRGTRRCWCPFVGTAAAVAGASRGLFWQAIWYNGHSERAVRVNTRCTQAYAYIRVSGATQWIGRRCRLALSRAPPVCLCVGLLVFWLYTLPVGIGQVVAVAANLLYQGGSFFIITHIRIFVKLLFWRKINQWFSTSLCPRETQLDGVWLYFVRVRLTLEETDHFNGRVENIFRAFPFAAIRYMLGYAFFVPTTKYYILKDHARFVLLFSQH